MEISQLYDLFLRHPEVTTDTRSCPPSSIFFALRGASFDGNAFARQALDAGCAYAVVDDPKVAAEASDERIILVPDALVALQQLAAYHRRKMGTPIVQITGTNGKTTTKELIAAVLAKKHNVLFTQGNFNNHIGVPKTLLRLTPQHTIGVIETGANHPGEIALLSEITDADCGLITNVGRAHLEGFGSFEGVVKTKGELYDYIRRKPGGFIFLDGDNEHLRAMTDGLCAITYGQPDHRYSVEGEVASCTPFLSIRWRENLGKWHMVNTHLIGSYNLGNILAAIAVGLHYGVSADDVSQAIADYQPDNSRSEYRQTDRNSLIIDAYNANPTSMKAALDNFSRIDHPHKMLILGEMRELGAASGAEHLEVASQICRTGCKDVWLVGKAFEMALCGDGIRWFPDVEAVEAELAAHPISDRLILIKGSNGTRLFRLPKLL